MKKKKVYLELTPSELEWLRWAIGELTSHPLWDKNYPTLKRLMKKCWKLEKGLK